MKPVALCITHCPKEHQDMAERSEAIKIKLDQAELHDAKRHKDKLASTHSNGWNEAGAPWLFPLGWHNGPLMKEVEKDWAIVICRQDDRRISEVVGFNVLSELPLIFP